MQGNTMLEVPGGTTRTKGNVHHLYKVWNVMRDLYPHPTVPTSPIYEGETGEVPGVLTPPPRWWPVGLWPLGLDLWARVGSPRGKGA